MARPQGPQPSRPKPAPKPPKHPTVLLAEDDPFTLQMYRIKLEKCGLKVVPARDGQEAYEAVKTALPDLVLLDVHMPKLSGFEVLAALKAEGRELPPERVIILTNAASPADRQQASALGLDYLIKADLTPRELLHRVNGRLGR